MLSSRGRRGFAKVSKMVGNSDTYFFVLFVLCYRPKFLESERKELMFIFVFMFILFCLYSSLTLKSVYLEQFGIWMHIFFNVFCRDICGCCKRINVGTWEKYKDKNGRSEISPLKPFNVLYLPCPKNILLFSWSIFMVWKALTFRFVDWVDICVSETCVSA